MKLSVVQETILPLNLGSKNTRIYHISFLLLTAMALHGDMTCKCRRDHFMYYTARGLLETGPTAKREGFYTIQDNS